MIVVVPLRICKTISIKEREVKNKYIYFVIVAISLFACSPVEIQTPDPTINEEVSPTQPEADPSTALPSPTNTEKTTDRTILSFQQLIDSFSPGSPVDDGAFAKPEDALPAEHVFEGRLELIGEDIQDGIQVKGAAYHGGNVI